MRRNVLLFWHFCSINTHTLVMSLDLEEQEKRADHNELWRKVRKVWTRKFLLSVPFHRAVTCKDFPSLGFSCSYNFSKSERALFKTIKKEGRKQYHKPTQNFQWSFTQSIVMRVAHSLFSSSLNAKVSQWSGVHTYVLLVNIRRKWSQQIISFYTEEM